MEEMKKTISALILSGFHIMPVHQNKKPKLLGWTDDTFEVSEEEMFGYIEQGLQLGIITGKKSGITVVDIDFALPGTFGTNPDTFPDTYTVRTPSGAVQKYYQYCPLIGQSQKGFPTYPDVDIRNDGGQVVAPPSTAVYTKTYKDGSKKDIIGNYEVLSGSILDLAPFPVELFEQYIAAPTKEAPHQPHQFNPTKPGDDFEQSVEWKHILSPFGWIQGHTDRSGSTHWARPQKDKEATSATTRVTEDGRDRLFVFSTHADPFEPYDKNKKNSYTKTTAYALLNHGGDYHLAVGKLKEQGYGIPEEEKKESALKTFEYLLTTEYPENRFALAPFFEQGSLNMVSAPPNTWKSWMFFLMATSISSGEAFLGKFETEQSGVMIVNEEDTERLIADRFRALGITNTTLPMFFRTAQGSKLDDVFCGELLKEAQEHNIKVIMFDSLRALTNADENSSTAMQPVLDSMKMLTREGITVIFTHHHKKKNQFDRGDNAESSRGSSAINAAISGHLSLEEVEREGEKFIIVRHLKSKVTQKLAPFEIQITIEHGIVSFAHTGDYEDTASANAKARTSVYEYLEKRQDRWIGTKEIIDAGVASDKYVRMVLGGMYVSGLLRCASKQSLLEENPTLELVGPKNAKFYKVTPITPEESEEQDKEVSAAFDVF